MLLWRRQAYPRPHHDSPPRVGLRGQIQVLLEAHWLLNQTPLHVLAQMLLLQPRREGNCSCETRGGYVVWRGRVGLGFQQTPFPDVREADRHSAQATTDPACVTLGEQHHLSELPSELQL